MNRSLPYFCCLLIFTSTMFVGCKQSVVVSAKPTKPADQSSDSLNSDAMVDSSENTETKSVNVTQQTLEASPAKPGKALPDRSASPDEVCSAFLKLLREGNRIDAESLMTRTALAVTGRAQLELEPLGSESARYDLGEPMYATNKQKLAHVVCRIIDEIDGETSESELTWMLRRQGEGWRISGILIQLEVDQPNDLLSFENFNDVLKIKNSLNGGSDEMEAPVVRQAENGNVDNSSTQR